MFNQAQRRSCRGGKLNLAKQRLRKRKKIRAAVAKEVGTGDVPLKKRPPPESKSVQSRTQSAAFF
jgi:hypothetical protein